MTTVTTDLLNARLKTVETRTDARVLAIEASGAAMERLVREFRAEIRADIKNLKTTMIVTAIASVLAIGAINATILSNMLAAFQSGKEIATAQITIIQTSKDIAVVQAEVKRQLEVTAAMLERVEARERQQAKDAKRHRD